MSNQSNRRAKTRLDLALIRFWTPVEVRYSDLDLQGHVNNATFFTYFEQGRVAFFAALRARHVAAQTATAAENSLASNMSAPGTLPATDAPDLPFVIASASCVYQRPIAALTPVVVGIRCANVTHATIEMEYAICDQPGGLLYATGTTLTVSIEPTSGRPRVLPEWARLALERM